MSAFHRLREFDRLARSKVPAPLLRRLEAFDREHAKKEGQLIFDWSQRHHLRATNWVGVIQIPGLQIEILPKLAHSTDEAAADVERRNFLYMLALGGQIPVRDRDLSGQSLLRESLLEVFISAFVGRLQQEVRRGVDRSYHDVEESCPFLRGKLLVSEQVRRSLTHKERFEVRYAVFGTDTTINRILRASCRRLRGVSRRLSNRNALQHVVQLLEDVDDTGVSLVDFQRVDYTRSSERFRPLIDFCRLLFQRRSPTQAAGSHVTTFSLLFPMETVFEAFVAGCVRRHARTLGLEPRDVHVQAAGRHEYLLRSDTNRRVYCLKPDLIVEGDDGPIILDTKWKRLDKGGDAPVSKPSTADMYQLYAYATRYRSRRSILLFPAVPGARARSYRLEGAPDQEALVRFLDLSRDLRREEESLVADLRDILGLQGAVKERAHVG